MKFVVKRTSDENSVGEVELSTLEEFLEWCTRQSYLHAWDNKNCVIVHIPRVDDILDGSIHLESYDDYRELL